MREDCSADLLTLQDLDVVLTGPIQADCFHQACILIAPKASTHGVRSHFRSTLSPQSWWQVFSICEPISVSQWCCIFPAHNCRLHHYSLELLTQTFRLPTSTARTYRILSCSEDALNFPSFAFPTALRAFPNFPSLGRLHSVRFQRFNRSRGVITWFRSR